MPKWKIGCFRMSTGWWDKTGQNALLQASTGLIKRWEFTSAKGAGRTYLWTHTNMTRPQGTLPSGTTSKMQSNSSMTLWGSENILTTILTLQFAIKKPRAELYAQIVNHISDMFLTTVPHLLEREFRSTQPLSILLLKVGLINQKGDKLKEQSDAKLRLRWSPLRNSNISNLTKSCLAWNLSSQNRFRSNWKRKAQNKLISRAQWRSTLQRRPD